MSRTYAETLIRRHAETLYQGISIDKVNFLVGALLTGAFELPTSTPEIATFTAEQVFQAVAFATIDNLIGEAIFNNKKLGTSDTEKEKNLRILTHYSSNVVEGVANERYESSLRDLTLYQHTLQEVITDTIRNHAEHLEFEDVEKLTVAQTICTNLLYELSYSAKSRKTQN